MNANIDMTSTASVEIQVAHLTPLHVERFFGPWDIEIDVTGATSAEQLMASLPTEDAAYFRVVPQHLSPSMLECISASGRTKVQIYFGDTAPASADVIAVIHAEHNGETEVIGDAPPQVGLIIFELRRLGLGFADLSDDRSVGIKASPRIAAAHVAAYRAFNQALDVWDESAKVAVQAARTVIERRVT